MTAQLGNGRYIGGFFSVGVDSEVFWHLPDEDLLRLALHRRQLHRERTLPSSDAEAINESLKGLLYYHEHHVIGVLVVRAYQSVSRTAAVCPRKRGICSGTRPFSLRGMTAKAPPPLASQFTEMYSGFACVE